jgi:hypothetical protein
MKTLIKIIIDKYVNIRDINYDALKYKLFAFLFFYTSTIRVSMKLSVIQSDSKLLSEFPWPIIFKLKVTK